MCRRRCLGEHQQICKVRRKTGESLYACLDTGNLLGNSSNSLNFVGNAIWGPIEGFEMSSRRPSRLADMQICKVIFWDCQNALKEICGLTVSFQEYPNHLRGARARVSGMPMGDVCHSYGTREHLSRIPGNALCRAVLQVVKKSSWALENRIQTHAQETLNNLHGEHWAVLQNTLCGMNQKIAPESSGRAPGKCRESSNNLTGVPGS